MYEFKKDMLVYLEDRTGRIYNEGNIIVVDGPIKDFPIVVDFPDRFRNQINRFRFDFSGIPHESNDSDYRITIPKLNRELNFIECGFKTEVIEHPILLSQLLDIDEKEYFKIDGLMSHDLIYYRIYLYNRYYINVVGEHKNIWEIKHLINKLIDQDSIYWYSLDERLKELKKSEIDVKDRTLRGPLSTLLKIKEPVNFWADIENKFFFWIDHETCIISRKILKLFQNSLI